jgi:hypothetical protein
MDYGREIYEALNRPPFDTLSQREWDYSPEEKDQNDDRPSYGTDRQDPRGAGE